MVTLCGRHVVFVLAGEVLGGAERGALDLAGSLRDVGARVSVLAFDDRPGRGREVAESMDVPWTSVPVPWTGGRVRRGASVAHVVRSLRGLRPDAVIASTNLPNVVSGLIWRATGATTAVWRQCDVNGTTRFAQRTFRHALHATPVVVTTAEHARTWLSDSFAIDPGRVQIIPTAVHLPLPVEAASAWRTRLGLSPDEHVWCMLAHLHAGKDHATLLSAWRLVVDELRDLRVTLLLAGRDAGNENTLKALAFDLDLRERVRFLGEVDDVAGLLDACNGAAFCSHRELLPRGVLEPMAVGLPVVATDLPGTREALGHRDPALLVPRSEPAELAAAILRIARDPAFGRRIGRENAEVVVRRQRSASLDGAWASLLSDALSPGGAP